MAGAAQGGSSVKDAPATAAEHRLLVQCRPFEVFNRLERGGLDPQFKIPHKACHGGQQLARAYGRCSFRDHAGLATPTGE